ncbi:cytochrome P450 [Suillus tomentosus]|nr:cytochrome P450 [Suillus tomentosus]
MSTLAILILQYLCLASVGVYLVKQIFVKKNPAPYPPGPRGLPLVGNLQDIPRDKSWLTFTEWGKKYGDISHINVLGMHIVVLNSVESAVEMLDKKSSIYSDRPVVPMTGELMGYGQTLAYLCYGERFRLFRKNCHRIFGSRAALVDYHPIEEMEAHRFLKRVLAKPDRLQAYVRLTAAAVVLRLCYGYEVKEDDDPLVDIAKRTLDQLSRYSLTGEFMVDFLPFLAKVPEWFPGAGFKRLARECRKNTEEMAAAPYKFVKDQVAAGIAPKSFASDLLKDRTLTPEEDYIVKWSAVSLFSGGADTTVSAIYSFFLAMTLFPDVQKKAQAEIDAVVGPYRLPSFADRASLPYVEALTKEVLRWNIVISSIDQQCSMSVDRSTIQDDIHDGYYIPKGSLIIINVWSMLNDPQTHANPSGFNPERFLAKDGKEPERDPRTVCFGFGRRLCPGLHLADASIWISIAMSLAVFNVSKVVENGVEITPEVDYTSRMISILPRSTVQTNTNSR